MQLNIGSRECLNKGSSCLPKYEGDNTSSFPSQSRLSTASNAMPGGISRVLYVDDEPALLDLTREYLEKTGEFKVDTVPSAHNATEALKEEPYDVVVQITICLR